MIPAGYGPADYLRYLQALLPPGAAWSIDPDAVLTRLLTVPASELALADVYLLGALAEADPRRTDQLLPQWEADCGLPSACAGPAIGLNARRQAVLAQLTARGGVSPGYFIAVAASLGFAVTITEFSPLVCELDCEQSANDEGWRFVWRVNAPAVPIIEDSCESDAETPLVAWGNALLQCTIQSMAPAHTYCLFGYGGS